MVDTSVLPFNSESSRTLPAWATPPGATSDGSTQYATGSPQWWVARLDKQLDDRRPALDRYDAYYRGDHPLPTAPAKAHEAFHRLLKMSRSNWLGLVVDAVAERVKVEGFRFGGDSAADKQAWKMWQANGLDVGAEFVHIESLINGISYVTVAPDPDNPRVPIIAPEHPSQTIVALDPANPRRRRAAFKKWLDDDAYLCAVLQMPNFIFKLRSEKPGSASSNRWVPREVDDEMWPLPNAMGVVTTVPFPNTSRLLTGGVSELEGLTDTQDRINKTLFDRLMAAEFSAFRQRWSTGMEIPTDPKTNQPVEPFKAAVDRLWMSEDPETKFGEFSETNLAGYISSVEADIQHLAAISRTPPHYLLGQSGAFPSGESLKSTETGLVAKVNRRETHWGESWEEVVRLSFLAIASPKANKTDAETIWRNPESRTLGELTDSLVKLRRVLEVPLEALWTEWGASPQKIEQWKAQRAAEMAGAPAPPPVNPEPPAMDGQ